MGPLVFTVTAGRTGTAWLAELLRRNGLPDALHEPLGVDDFGVRMPEIRTMRLFNERGMVPDVAAFWERKLATLPAEGPYAETNHTLAKCGLVEALAARRPAAPVCLVCLRRDRARLAASLLRRGDFANLTLIWQWYLDPACRRRIVPPEPLLMAHGPLVGGILWYVLEMEARQAYYALLYGDRFRFLFCELEELATPEGARRLLQALGLPAGQPVLPPCTNATRPAGPEPWRERLQAVVAALEVDPAAEARRFVESGGRLGEPAP